MTATATATEPSNSRPKMNTDIARQECKDWLDRFQLAFPERDSIGEAFLVCAIACVNMLLIGLPGTAKSAMTRSFASAITGRVFEILMTRYTTPDELIGPLSIKELKNDRLTRIRTGRLAEAQVAFIDEIFKANSACLNALLPAANERILHDDGKVLNLPLRIMVGASNELPDEGDTSLQAFDDRFPVRFDVNRLQSLKNFQAMVQRKLPPIMQTISVDGLNLLTIEAKQLPITDDVCEALWKINEKLSEKGIYCSDRKFSVACDILRARAALAGSPKVTSRHIGILEHVFWLRPEQQAAVREIVRAHVAKWMNELLQATAVIDQQEADMASAIKRTGSMTATSNAITKVVQKLKELNKDVLKDLHGVPEARDDVERLQERINGVIADGKDAMSKIL